MALLRWQLILLQCVCFNDFLQLSIENVFTLTRKQHEKYCLSLLLLNYSLKDIGEGNGYGDAIAPCHSEYGFGESKFLLVLNDCYFIIDSSFIG